MQKNDKFDLEFRYKDFLCRVKLDEDKMLPIQRKEMKRAFFAGLGEMFVLMSEDMSQLEEESAMRTMESLNTQIKDFWLNQILDKN